MPLVNYEGDSSEEEDNNNGDTIQPKIISKPPTTTRQLQLPTASSNVIIDDDDDDDFDNNNDQDSMKITTTASKSSTLLANLPKPQDISESTTDTNATELAEGELEDIVRGENKEYAKNIPQLPKSVKRKRDGPVKIFVPTVEDDSDDEDKPKRKQTTMKRNCPLLNYLPPPVYDEDNPTTSLPAVKAPSTTTPQISSTGLFIPYTINKKQQQKKPPSTTTKQLVQQNTNESDDEDDDEDQADFLGLAKSDQIQVTNTDVESVLRETFLKLQPTVVEEPVLPNPQQDFVDLDDNQQSNYQQRQQDDDELLKYLPKSEHYKEIKHVNIDSMLSDNARIQLLKNRTEEREAMLAQAAIHVPKGESKKRSQITYLIAKAQHDDLQLKNMWSDQKLTKRQTQAKYGF